MSIENTESGVNVYLKVYDLAPQIDKKHLSTIMGFQIDAVWHTSIEIFGREYYFGNGIQIEDQTNSFVCHFAFIEKIHLGQIYIKENDFNELVEALKISDWTDDSYNLFDKNCNHFTYFMATSVFELDIPKKYVELSEKAKKSSLSMLFFQNNLNNKSN